MCLPIVIKLTSHKAVAHTSTHLARTQNMQVVKQGLSSVLPFCKWGVGVLNRFQSEQPNPGQKNPKDPEFSSSLVELKKVIRVKFFLFNDS